MFVEAPPKRKKSPENIFNPKWWQDKGIKWLLKKAEAGLFLAPGLGKTAVALFAFYILWKKGIVTKLLVISKRRIIYNVWRQEIIKWGLPFKVALVHGQSKNVEGKTKKRRELERNADVYLINFDALEWLAAQPPRIVKKFAGAMLVIDESAKVKTWTGNRMKALKKLLPLFKRRVIMSGSPTPQSMQDIFSQIYVLDMGDSLGRFIGAFRNTYFYTVEMVLKNPLGEIVRRWNDYELMEGAEEKIYKKLRRLVLRIPEEVVGLKPLIPVTREMELPARARKAYIEVELEFMTKLKKGLVTAANAGVATAKLRQIASGMVYYKEVQEGLDEDGQVVYKPQKKYEVVHDEKLKELVSLVSELRGLPALIAYQFDHERIEIQKRLKCPAIYGKTSDRQTDELIEQWNAGKLPVLLGHPASISHGLNLQGTKAAIIFFTCGYNLDDHEQFIRRVWRQGQKEAVTAYYLNAVNTLDDVVQGVLTLKDRNQKRLLRALEARYKKGDNMATSKAKNESEKKTSKKGASPTKAAVKKAIRKVAKKKAPPKRKAAKKAAKKKATHRKAAAKKTLEVRTDGLKKGTLQAMFVDLCKRKTGVTMDEACDRLKTTAGSLRVTASVLRDKGFKLTHANEKYKIG